MRTDCLFCGSREIEFRFKGSDRLHEVEGTYQVYRCNACGLLFLNPQPSAASIAAHYPSNYYSFQQKHPDQARDTRVYQAVLGTKSTPLKKIAYLPYVPFLRTMAGRPKQRLLDVGCGAGNFLVMAKDILEVEPYGVEPYAHNTSVAAENNLNIYYGELEHAHFSDDFFDVITLNHVFEHVGNPRETLRELRRILKPSGTLIIGVPQSNNLLYWLFDSNWVGLDVPRHIFVPSTENLKQVASREGLKFKRIRYNSTPWNILATLYYWRNQTREPKAYLRQFVQGKLAARVLLPTSYMLNLLRLSDQVEIFLTKDNGQ